LITGGVDMIALDVEMELRESQRQADREFLHDYQRVPDGDWEYWLFMSGRGAGKTLAGSHATIEHLREFGPDAWAVILAPTIGDARKICVEGPTGIYTLFRHEFTEYNKTLLTLEHVDGGRLSVFGGDEPKRLRGPQSTWLWIDELASIMDETVDNVILGNRIGENPRAMLTTTPRKRKMLKEFIDDPRTHLTQVATDANVGLSDKVKRRFYDKYGGTRLGRQELLGEYIEDVEGAMFKSSWIDDNRVAVAPEMERVIVAVDPATTARKVFRKTGEINKKASSDQTGVVVCGKGIDGDYYVLYAIGLRASPATWARKAIDLFDEYGADKIIGERNNGGDMVEAVIRQQWDDAPLDTVHASRGKMLRAEPVALLYEKNRVHHVGVFEGLEDQQTTFPVENELDDELDASVYAITELMNESKNELLMGKVGNGIFNPSIGH
jgi:predicted phage terminase large subunit-like protein